MANETQNKSRTNVALRNETHMAVATIATLLGMDIQQAVEAAMHEWLAKNSALAKKKANQVFAVST